MLPLPFAELCSLVQVGTVFYFPDSSCDIYAILNKVVCQSQACIEVNYVQIVVLAKVSCHRVPGNLSVIRTPFSISISCGVIYPW